MIDWKSHVGGDTLPQVMAMIERFIGFDTTSRDSNLPLIHFAQDYFAELGVESVVTLDAAGRKGNLLATVGPKERAGFILSGHTDTVPVDDQIWSSNPFALNERGGKVYGRGVCDMKGFLAIATALVPTFLSKPLKSPIHIAMSYDEEVGCLGVHDLIADLRNRFPNARGCIVGEPTGMGVVRAHKGKIGGHVTVRGHEAHSSAAHLGVSAVEAAAEAVAYFKRIQRRLRDEGPFDPDFETPSYTTLQCCMMSGGTAVNTIAGHASFDFDIRHLPAVDPRSYVDECRRFVESNVEPELKRISPQCGFTWEEVPGCAALDTKDGSDIVELAKLLSGTTHTRKVGFGTEAGYFQQAGIQTVVCGPGSISEAHKPDEFIEIDQVSRCVDFLTKLSDRLS